MSIAELNAELVKRTSGPEALDNMFFLPSWITNETLMVGYEIIVSRMRREAGHVTMNTIQQLLLERIAFNYVVLRSREQAAIGSAEGFADPKVIKEFNTFWLAMTKEFNELLVKFKPSDKEAVMAMVRACVEEILATIPAENSALRNDLIMRFVDTFKREGLIAA